MMAACQTASQKAAAPAPEPEQVISDQVKELYMQVSTAPHQSRQQQKLILHMAETASNGKELFLVMRAAAGVFPAEAGSPGQDVERQLRAAVTAKMMKLATLDQLIDYAAAYPADAADVRALVERMFELGKASSDPRVWYRIRAAAFHLRLKDMELQAQAKADALASQ